MILRYSYRSSLCKFIYIYPHSSIVGSTCYIYISHIVITMSRHKSNPDGESIMDHIAIVMDQLLFVGSCS